MRHSPANAGWVAAEELESHSHRRGASFSLPQIILWERNLYFLGSTELVVFGQLRGSSAHASRSGASQATTKLCQIE